MSKAEQIVNLVNSIQAEARQQGEALVVASQAMEVSHGKVNELIHFIRKMDNKPITQDERLILERLYEIASVLSNAAVDMKFGAKAN